MADISISPALVPFNQTPLYFAGLPEPVPASIVLVKVARSADALPVFVKTLDGMLKLALSTFSSPPCSVHVPSNPDGQSAAATQNVASGLAID